MKPLNASYITPAVTLLDGEGKPDPAANSRLYEHLIAGGVDGILVLGSIGEFFALPMEQRRAVALNAIRTIDGRVKLLIGTASMVFEEIIPFSNECLEAGADAVIVISPYYFPLGDEEAFAFFDRVAAGVRGPVYLYNFPARTGYSLSADVVARLALAHPNIVGIKDTIPGMDHTRELIERLKPLRPDFEIYSGFDENLAANVIAGGDGCIAGLSNVYPELCAQAAHAFREGDWARAVTGQRLIQQLFALYAIGGNFIPIMKEGLGLRGVAQNSRCTFPLPACTDVQREQLQKLMAEVETAASAGRFLQANFFAKKHQKIRFPC